MKFKNKKIFEKIIIAGKFDKFREKTFLTKFNLNY